MSTPHAIARARPGGLLARLSLTACAVLFVVPASAPAATPASCQVQITEDVTFDRDLDCEGRGPLMIAADDVTVDLAGHTLSSTFGGLIRNRGHDHVKLVNGRLLTQAVAVEMSGRHNLVQGVSGFGDIAGVWFHDGSRNRIVDSTIDGRGIGPGDLLERERRDTISGSTAAQSPIDLHATRRSRLIRNDAPGGILLDADSRRNRLADNRARGLRSPGLRVAGSRNRLLDNEVSDTIGDDGILITGGRNLLVGNRVSGDGIEVSGPRNRLEDNLAVDNELLGINAVLGTIDLGGNRASGNGDPRQCVGVACSP